MGRELTREVVESGYTGGDFKERDVIPGDTTLREKSFKDEGARAVLVPTGTARVRLS